MKIISENEEKIIILEENEKAYVYTSEKKQNCAVVENRNDNIGICYYDPLKKEQKEDLCISLNALDVCQKEMVLRHQESLSSIQAKEISEESALPQLLEASNDSSKKDTQYVKRMAQVNIEE